MNLVKYLKIVGIVTVLIASNVNAAFKDTNNVKVEMISVMSKSGNISVRTTPRPDLSGLTCTNNNWLVLYKDDIGYNATLAMLLSAQATQKAIKISAEDDNGNEWCKLRRVINLSN